MKSQTNLNIKNKYALVALSCTLFFAASFNVRQNYKLFFPPPNQIKAFQSSTVEDVLALNLGARRLFADLWFVRLIQYYGTPEDGLSIYKPMTKERAERYGKGKYPHFFPMSKHIIHLDPYFKHAVLYSAGCLAFNMNRPKPAIELLDLALVYLPKEWKYLTMLAAIGYSKAENPGKVASALMPLINESDCPVMVKQLVAFLQKTAGDYVNAYKIYQDIAQTSKDEFYVKNAIKEMHKMRVKKQKQLKS
ncbi:MAG: hypothetical protein U9Q34_07545 [Elusimicrobiota bacterium]|nr:hypothetical protein [Elusimicrobiota bacterium]